MVCRATMVFLAMSRGAAPAQSRRNCRITHHACYKTTELTFERFDHAPSVPMRLKVTACIFDWVLDDACPSEREDSTTTSGLETNHSQWCYDRRVERKRQRRLQRRRCRRRFAAFLRPALVQAMPSRQTRPLHIFGLAVVDGLLHGWLFLPRPSLDPWFVEGEPHGYAFVGLRLWHVAPGMKPQQPGLRSTHASTQARDTISGRRGDSSASSAPHTQWATRERHDTHMITVLGAQGGVAHSRTHTHTHLLAHFSHCRPRGNGVGGERRMPAHSS